MSLVVTITAVGRRKPLLGDFEVPPPEDLRDDGELLLRDLIAHVVRVQVRAFNDRRDRARFDRVLSAKEIEHGAERGKIGPEGRLGRRAADPDEAVGAALRAFEDGMYLVIIDEVERRSLNEPVYLSPTSRIVFVRLVFLAGA